MEAYCVKCHYTAPNPQTAEEAVAAGAKLLTEYFGDESWKGDIDVKALNIADWDRCILGQLFGLYDDGKVILGIDNISGGHYGFDFAGHTGFATADLEAAWRNVLSPVTV